MKKIMSMVFGDDADDDDADDVVWSIIHHCLLPLL